jgi:hypothetical protein
VRLQCPSVLSIPLWSLPNDFSPFRTSILDTPNWQLSTYRQKTLRPPVPDYWSSGGGASTPLTHSASPGLSVFCRYVDNCQFGVSVLRGLEALGMIYLGRPWWPRRRQALTPAQLASWGTLRTPVYNQSANRRRRSDPRTGPGDSEEHAPRTGVLRVMSWDLR